MNEGKPHGKMEQKESKKVISVEKSRPHCSSPKKRIRKKPKRQETKEVTRETKRRLRRTSG